MSWEIWWKPSWIISIVWNKMESPLLFAFYTNSLEQNYGEIYLNLWLYYSNLRYFHNTLCHTKRNDFILLRSRPQLIHVLMRSFRILKQQLLFKSSMILFCNGKRFQNICKYIYTSSVNKILSFSEWILINVFIFP